jgi:hypothetical protein
MCSFREDVAPGLARGWFHSFEVQGWVVCSPVVDVLGSKKQKSVIHLLGLNPYGRVWDS